jgi:selenoprotein W-related protein
MAELSNPVNDLPLVEIQYCRQCRWLLRAAWMAQELLSTFEDELGGVTLVPGTGGVFIVKVQGDVVWSRKAEGRFPDITELKQRVRDRAAPDKALGHIDRKPKQEASQ